MAALDDRSVGWDRSAALIAWSRALIAWSRRLQRPVFRRASDTGGGGMIRVTDLSGITVIVVDDNDDNVDVFATFLRGCGRTLSLGEVPSRPARASTASLQ